MPDSSKDNSSYNEEMRRWMAKQSFWHRLKYGRHPGDSSRLFGFMVKVIVLFLVVMGAALAAYSLAVKKRVSSEDFAKDFHAAAAESLDLRMFDGSSLVWSAGVARIGSLDIKGGRSNFFSTLEVNHLNFPLKIFDVLGGDWKIRSIEGRGAEVNLRSGAFTDREWQELLRTDEVKQEKGEGGWMSPSVDLKSIDEVSIRDANFRWGAKPWMAGSLTGCDLDATRLNGGWTVRINNGSFSQNWIRNAEIEKLVLEIDAAGIRVAEGKLKMPSGGKMNVSGTISLADDPEFDLAVRIDKFRFSDFLSEENALFVSGEFGAEVRITGSVNRTEGLISKGRLVAEPASSEPDGGADRDRPWLVKMGRNIDAELAVFRAFGDAMGADGIRYFTSERTVIDFETRMGNLVVTEMKFYDPLVGQMNGAFSFEGKSKLITDGSLTISLKDKVFENNRELREVRSTLFNEGRNGASEFTIELKGPIDRLTLKEAQRILEVAELGD